MISPKFLHSVPKNRSLVLRLSYGRSMKILVLPTNRTLRTISLESIGDRNIEEGRRERGSQGGVVWADYPIGPSVLKNGTSPCVFIGETTGPGSVLKLSKGPKKFLSKSVAKPKQNEFGNFLRAIFSTTLIDCDFRPIESMQPMKSLARRLWTIRNQATNRIRQEFIRFPGWHRAASIRTISQSIQNFCSPASDLVVSRPSFEKLSQEKFSHAKRFEKFSSFNFCVRSVGPVGASCRPVGPPPGSFSPAF